MKTAVLRRALSWKRLPAVVLSVLLIASLAGCACARKPRVEYLKYEALPGRKPIDLSKRLRRCSRQLEREVGSVGKVVVYYPPDFDEAVVERIAEHYGAFFSVAEAVVGRGLYTEAHVYVLPVPAMPDSYKVRVVRRGAEWHRRHLAAVLVPPGDLFESREYWSQVKTDVHELAHHYTGFSSSVGWLPSHLRWIAEGTCDLVQMFYLERFWPKLLDTMYELPQGLAAFGDSVFHWEYVDEEKLIRDTGKAWAEASRYRVAFYLVLAIYEMDEGESLRAFLRALRQERPSDREQVEGIMRKVLGLGSEELLARARQAAEARALGGAGGEGTEGPDRHGAREGGDI